MQLYRPVFPLKQQGQNCSGVKRLKYNGWKDFYSFRATSSTRQMPYGLRWETHIEGLRDSKSNQNNNKKNGQQKKDPKAALLSQWRPTPKRRVSRAAVRSWASQCGDERCSCPQTVNAIHWKKCPPCSGREKSE